MRHSLTTIALRVRRQVRLVLWLLPLSLLLLGMPATVAAAIYTCPAADGSTIFQDRPCPRSQNSAKKTQTVRSLPFNIHPSWFELPGQAAERAFCDRRRCECGLQERQHGNSMARAVADALYIDGGWHRYETAYRQWRDEPAGSPSNPQLLSEMQEAACSVMMSQQLLREFADEVSSKLRQQVREAEERGFDTPGPCEAGIEQACDYLDAVELHQRMMLDARALQLPRDLVTSDSTLPLDQ